MKITKRLSKDNFKAFIKYLKDNSLGYYSRFKGGFIMTNTQRAASVAIASLYSADILDVFANGTLF